MIVIVHQAIAEQPERSLESHLLQNAREFHEIVIVLEYVLAAVAARHDMEQSARIVNSRQSGHTIYTQNRAIKFPLSKITEAWYYRRADMRGMLYGYAS